MAANTTAIPGHRPAVKAQSEPRWPYDRRSPIGQRISKLKQELSTRIGDSGTDPFLTASLWRAAELCVIAQQARVRAVRGLGENLDDLVRCERLAERAIARLRLDERANERQRGPNLQEYLASKQREAIA